MVRLPLSATVDMLYKHSVLTKFGIPFGHSEGSFRPNVKKSEKSLEMGSRGLPAPGAKKSERVKNELKSLKKVNF